MITDSIEIQAWVRRGGMMYNTECLGYDDPMHPYNQIVNQGHCPEDYGVYNPLHKEFGGRTRQSLIDEILGMRREILAYQAAGF